MVALSGFGITAFGIAPLAPDAARLPQTWVQEEVKTLDLAAQVDALAQQDLVLWRSDVVRGSENPERLLYRLGIQDVQAAAFLRADPLARKLLAGRTKMLQARSSAEGALVELVARFAAEDSSQAKTHFSRLTVARHNGVLTSRLDSAPLQAGVRLASGSIRSSLYAATDEARLPDNVAAQLAEIFSADIDFHRELRKGDSFSVVYESLSADGQPVVWNEGAGRILAAEFVNRGRAHHALWFDGGSKATSAYFGLDGKSMRRAFLASPLEFSRITSGFAQRFHPILQRWRAHLGVDYAAPSGTPVRTVGDGVVSFAGWQNGYGKVVEVEHDKQRSTLYAHLSAIDVKVGQRVEQGQLVGKVGSTGWSTGPHLHFEFRVGGVHQDPQLVAKANEEVQLDPAARGRFAQQATLMQTKLSLAESQVGAPRQRIE
jgi:murein DD-endopeptidase MepM/ murein hydrolase activator NlpD